MNVGPASAQFTRDHTMWETLLADSAAKTGNGTFVNTFAPGAPRAGSTSYNSFTRLTEGPSVLVPRTRATVDTLSGDGATVTTGPAHGQTGSWLFSGGLFVTHAGRRKILLIPHQAANFVLYDILAGTCAPLCPRGITPPNGNTPAWAGASLGISSEDIVYLAPGAGACFAALDLRTGLITPMAVVPVLRNPANTGDVTIAELGVQTTQVHGGIQLTPLGEMLVANRSSAYPHLRFNPATNTVSTIANSGNTSNGYIIIPQRNEALCIPRGGSYSAHFISLSSFALRVGGNNGSNAASTNLQACGAVPMRDGRYYFGPGRGTYGLIYDPATDGWSAAAVTGGTTSAENYVDAVAGTDGRVLLLASSEANFGVATLFTGGTPLSGELHASRFYNTP